MVSNSCCNELKGQYQRLLAQVEGIVSKVVGDVEVKVLKVAGAS